MATSKDGEYIRLQSNSTEHEQKQVQAPPHALKPGIAIIQHAMRKSLRVQPGNEHAINGKGGRGQFARWNLEIIGANAVKFKSTKSGKYLRIIKNGNECDVRGGGGVFTVFKYNPADKSLESNKFPGCFLATDKYANVVAVCKAKTNSDVYSFRFDIIHAKTVPKKGNYNGFGVKYNFNRGLNGAALVVIRSQNNGKSLRVKPGKEVISNCLGGFGAFARWKLVYHKNNIYKLQSNRTNKFIRISPKNNGAEVDVNGSGGKYTQFRVKCVRDTNVVTFESVVFPNKYLATKTNGSVYVYNAQNGEIDDKECVFGVWMQQHNNQKKKICCNNMDQRAVIQSQQELIEQQKRFIDQLQKTVERQQGIIGDLTNMNQQRNTQMNDGETDDGFEYVSSPGCSAKK